MSSFRTHRQYRDSQIGSRRVLPARPREREYPSELHRIVDRTDRGVGRVLEWTAEGLGHGNRILNTVEGVANKLDGFTGGLLGDTRHIGVGDVKPVQVGLDVFRGARHLLDNIDRGYRQVEADRNTASGIARRLLQILVPNAE